MANRRRDKCDGIHGLRQCAAVRIGIDRVVHLCCIVAVRTRNVSPMCKLASFLRMVDAVNVSFSVHFLPAKISKGLVKTIDPRMPRVPGRSTPGFHRPGRHRLHQARSAAR